MACHSILGVKHGMVWYGRNMELHGMVGVRYGMALHYKVMV